MAISQATGWVAVFETTFDNGSKQRERIPILAWIIEDGDYDGLIYVEDLTNERRTGLTTIDSYANRFHNVKFRGLEDETPRFIPANPGERLQFHDGDSCKVLAWKVQGHPAAFVEVSALIVDGDGCGQLVGMSEENGEGKGFNDGWIVDNWRGKEPDATVPDEACPE